MAFDDLVYGWFREQFDLTGATLTGELNLYAIEEDGKLSYRWPLDVVTNEAEQKDAVARYESVRQTKYVPTRTITANARSQALDAVFRGVPVDKKNQESRDARMERLSLCIQALGPDDLARLGGGRIQYWKAREHNPELIYMHLFVAVDVFDQIECFVTQPDIAITAAINVRGWHWLGPIGDSNLYIDTEGFEKAELASFVVRRAIAHSDVGDPRDSEEGKHRKVSLEDVHGKVSSVDHSIRSLVLVAWIIAAVLGVMVVQQLF